MDCASRDAPIQSQMVNLAVFEKITLQRSIGRQPLTAGELAEALLFYKDVHIVFNESNFIKLAQSVGVPTLIEIISRPNVSAVYCKDGVTGTMTNFVGGVQYHDLCSISTATAPHIITDRAELLAFLLERSGASSGFEAKRHARQLRQLMSFQSYARDDFVAGGIFEAARQDVLDHTYVSEAVRRSLNTLVPLAAPLPRFRFDVLKVDGGFVVDTDLDFNHLSQFLPEADRLSGEKITPAVLLDIIFMTRVDLTIAAHYESELHTWSLVSDLMRLRCSDLVQRVTPELTQAANFREVVFSDGRTIKEAIDSGERQLTDFPAILERSERFREWAHELAAEANLVREYITAVMSDDWISSMPVKALRYIFAVQAQLADTVLAGIPGLVLSAVDSLLLDRLLRGWKPNHFVDRSKAPANGALGPSALTRPLPFNRRLRRFGATGRRRERF
jgi:hypothetical protein